MQIAKGVGKAAKHRRNIPNISFFVQFCGTFTAKRVRSRFSVEIFIVKDGSRPFFAFFTKQFYQSFLFGWRLAFPFCIIIELFPRKNCQNMGEKQNNFPYRKKLDILAFSWYTIV